MEGIHLAKLSVDPILTLEDLGLDRKAGLIGIGAVVTHRPLPHHRAYGSVHGGSSGYAVTLRPMMEDQAIGSRHWRALR
jgi:hypothetical protein